MSVSEMITVLGAVLGVLTPLGGIGVFVYRKQNKQLKDAEVQKAKLEAKSSEWQIIKDENERIHHMNQILIERNEKLVQMNAEKEDRHAEDLREKEDRFKDQTNRLREVQRDLVAALEREKEHVRKESRLERERDHYREWRCVKPWQHCKRREPEQPIKHDHYTPIDRESDMPCQECQPVNDIEQ